MSNRLRFLRVRRAVYERSGGLCGFCHEPVPFAAMHIDHIRPSCVDGSDELENLQASHAECNIAAGAKGYRYSTPTRRKEGAAFVRIRGSIPNDLHARLKVLADADERSLHWEALRVFRRGLDLVEAEQSKAS